MTTPAAHTEQQPPAWTGADLAGDPHAHAEKAEKVRRMFAAIARSYDLNNRLHSFGRDQAWRRAAVRAAQLRPTDAVLDVACGTGDLTRAFADAGASIVVGLDFTAEMLDIARTKPLAGHKPGAMATNTISYVQGDAMALPFEDASFDVVSIAFGIRNVTDPAKALREFRRVLRPGGRLVILEFSRPRNGLIAALNTLYTSRIMPVTASLIARDRSGAYRYLPKSVQTFLTPREMTDRIQAAGFDRVTTRALTFGVCTCYQAAVPA